MILLLALLLAQTRVPAPPFLLPPSEPAAGFALFKRICLDNYPDRARIERSVAAEGPQFVREVQSAPARQSVWLSPTSAVSFIESSERSNRPAPQCGVTIAAARNHNTDAIFDAFGAVAGLGAPIRFRGNHIHRYAEWDVGRAQQQWTVRFGRTVAEGRYRLSMSIINQGPAR